MAAVSLREITRETVNDILRLKVAPAQERFVASNAISIAQAHFHPATAWFRAVHAGETPVGFVMLSIDRATPRYELWRFMIDARFQRTGCGRAALQQVIAHVRSLPGARELFTSVVPGEGCPGPFYESLGFVYTGEVDEDESVLRLDLVPR